MKANCVQNYFFSTQEVFELELSQQWQYSVRIPFDLKKATVHMCLVVALLWEDSQHNRI